ncbi:hypothetical protein E7Z59_12515 [Robertkochia marina]|uniref:HEPN domain-containing protein n=1 Tax=Robertkochia marina TaxID=1227945 RepID=A0A4S3LYD8_9FLAO|nr:hypothetical protein [Robertkochia marina]THD66608.1 hypothetical protein E7Z59_12515 [Robertkochia marina]TRZ45554.1 hypothetical protein D3A96_06115 [Robertkochia marina]
METTLIRSNFEQALQCLEAAKNELNRPAEDVVPFMVCRSARNSISHSLMGFLLKNDTVLNEGESLDVLLEKCRTLDKRFLEFDLSPLEFDKDEEYSAEPDKMESCIDLALFARQLAGAS